MAQIAYYPFQALACQPNSVQYGTIIWQPEHTRARIALLRQGCYRAYLDKSEAQSTCRAENLAVAVESRGKPYGIFESHAEHLPFQLGVFDSVQLVQQPFDARHTIRQAQKRNGQMVSPLLSENK